ncbi:MAG: proline--tRNA ligase [Candidatus Eisenbacteria sp.]|jgi:prolyl-tRNA synthetase|nr:proline--tRNA ligase [Candidatus Eisenbacteria bacterium]MCK5596520.1 proline--tRNA ligase [Candidatus Eisenbacteria bacterium]
MRWSKALIPTHKEDPSAAETTSHKLMLRSGCIRKLTSGVYNYLPLGRRALLKVEQIVREEMDAVGCQEILMPVLCPSELWRETGRWDVYGKELWRVRDRNSREFALGPTHEEVVTDIVRNEVRSYRELPFTVYQIQTKFRDELRPRFGVVRSREFLMKDAYSFHRDDESLDETYRDICDAYTRIFERCSLTFRPVEAATGAIGGSHSHEFMVLSDTGESEIIVCECGYAATDERAEGAVDPPPCDEAPGEMERVETPEMRTIEQVSEFLGIDPGKLVKTIIYEADGRPVAALVRGDREISEAKLSMALGADLIVPAPPDVIEKLTGAPVGFTGPVGLEGIDVIADHTVEPLVNVVVGGNAQDVHLKNVKPGRDFKVTAFHDIVLVRKGDRCARCGAELDSFRGIEVSQAFKLGTKYSSSMNATYLDEDGVAKPFIMGCYGLGVSRTVAAIIEQHNDKDGITWPLSVAPFAVEILVVSMKSEECTTLADRLYTDLKAAGVDVLYDDRDDSAGVKFKDADLVGMPLRVTIGARGLKSGVVEARVRKTGEVTELPVDDAVQGILRILETLP